MRSVKTILGNGSVRWWWILCVPLFYGCLPEPLVVGRLPAADSRMVVSSQVVPGGGLLVSLTRTIGALDASGSSDPETLLEQIAVNDAIVILTGPDGSDTLTLLEQGVYGIYGMSFDPGVSYQLTASSPAFGDVEAVTTAMEKIDFDNVSATLFYNGYGDTLAQISYRIRDPADANWYMINVQEVEREDFERNLLNPRAFTVLLDDAAFNGAMHSDVFRVFPRDYQPGDSIAVTLSNISESYYSFMKLRLDNRFSFVEFISEPVNYPSNVIGGRGYFNLFLPDVHFFVLE